MRTIGATNRTIGKAKTQLVIQDRIQLEKKAGLETPRPMMVEIAETKNVIIPARSNPKTMFSKRFGINGRITLCPGPVCRCRLLIGVDLGTAFHRQADVIQTIEQAMPLEGIEVEFDDAAIRPADFQRFQIN